MSAATPPGRHPGPPAGPPGALEILPGRPRARPVSVDAPVLDNRHLTDRYWRLRLLAPEIAATFTAGQFVMLTVTRTPGQGPVLPRPMAIYDADPAAGWIELVYSVVGVGTHALTGFRADERLGTVGPLGRCFEAPQEGGVLLLGRGIGTCSLMPLSARLPNAAASTAVASGRHPEAVIGSELYRERGLRCLPVHDADGSADPAALRRRLCALHDDQPPALIAACGAARLEALALELADRWGSEVQVALEAHMACGLGYCHGCSTGDRDATTESPLICRDGPVFRLRPRPAVQPPAQPPTAA